MKYSLVFPVALCFLIFAVSSTFATTAGCHEGGSVQVVTSDIHKGISLILQNVSNDDGIMPDPYPLEGLSGVGMMVSASATFSLQSLTFFDHHIPLKEIAIAAQAIVNTCCDGATCNGGSAHVPGYLSLVEISA
ncbi:unnamed protein product [Calypogeia fissa]